MSDIYGTSGNDTRQGTVGSDNIYGYAQGADPDLETGNDDLYGADGRDNIYGGGGNDTLHGGNLNDRLFGGKGDDQLYGDSDNDYLDGGEGDDVFWVGGNAGGIDTFVGGAGSDTVRLYEALTRSEIVLDAAAGVEVLDLAGFALAGSSGSDTYDFSGLVSVTNAAGVIDLGSGNDTFYGHEGADAVNGGNSNDTIQGRGGDDEIYGGSGRDLLDGGDGDDTFWIGDVDTDTFAGGAGTDTVKLTQDTGRQFLTLDAAAAVEGLDANGFALSGTIADDDFDLSGLQSLAAGRKGIVLLDGDDSYLGSAAADNVNGGAGADTLDGGAGKDRLDGGGGADTLTGGEGADSFVFSVRASSAADADTIADFDTSADRMLFDNRAFDRIGRDGRLPGDAFAVNDTGRAEDKEDRLVYDSDSGNLFYDANGSARGKAVLVAHLDPGLALGAGDFLIV